MALKIPPPWQPAYAIPDYVRAEGLRNRAFVTKWAPRGTYDDPDAHDPSWDKSLAVPQYIKDEGYGQGAKVSEWAPRGTYAGGNKPAPAKNTGKKTALGDFEGKALPASYNRFGQRAAKAVLKRVGALPPDSRKAALKKILDVIDKDLWARSSHLAAELERKGVHPSNAVHTALARAMSEGAAREVIETGKRQSAPSLNSVMGLGAYGARAALGATETVPGHWERARAGSSCPDPGPNAPAPKTGYCWIPSYTREEVATVPSTTRPQQTPELSAVGLTFLQIGPWVMQDKAGASVTDHRALTAEQQKVLITGIAKASAKAYAHGERYTGNLFNYADYGLGMGSTRVFVASAVNGTMPIAKFTHPTSNEICVIYAKFVGAKDAPAWQISWNLYTSAWEWLIGALVELVAAVIAPIVDAIKEVANLACQLATSSDAVKTGTQIALTAKAGPEAGAAGAQIIQNACSQPTAPPPPPPAPSTPAWLVPVAIGGAILAGAYFLLPKKKRSP